MQIQANYSLKNHNTFSLEAQARYYVEIDKPSDITHLRSDPKLSALPWIILGGGSNTLITQNLDALVIHNKIQEIKITKQDEDNIWLSVGAGKNWADLVSYTTQQGWWGLENLAYIPGTVGAAPVQNIGAYGTEVRDLIHRVQTINLRNGELQEYNNAACEFRYRGSIFKDKHKEQLVHRVTFQLKKLHAGQANLSYEPLKKAVLDSKTTPTQLADLVTQIRKQRLPDLTNFPNAGSYFKNPIITEEHLDQLLADYPEMPHHQQQDGSFKVSAAWLIEQAELKGYRHENAGVSAQHSLVLVNLGKATGQEILDLAQQVQEKVQQKFTIYLEPEVTYI